LRPALLFSVFVVASCGLAYELIAAALSSYVLGDSITQFSTVIGTYLFAMGVGSWLSKFIDRGLTARFIQIELMVGVVGGFSAVILFMVFAHLTGPFRFVLYGLVFTTGVLVGLEIPLIMRILKSEVEFKDLVAQVLSFDYLGALAVSILFPIILAPHLGLMRTSLLFGLMNVLVALWAMKLFRESLRGARLLRSQGATALLALLLGFVFADKLTALAEEGIYADQILYAESTPYQRIVLTRWRDDLRLFLNGNLQFSSRDEYRYHEALVHPALATLPGARRVLILGGGDGLAAREVLKYPNVESITLVDLDPRMTTLFKTNRLLANMNQGSLSNPKVKVVNQDALVWLEQNPDVFDLALIDFPDPSNYSLGKLYSSAFYRLLEKHLSDRGLLVIQATSPFYARKSYWCIVATLEDAGLKSAPYHAYVPSFGEWGYIIGSRNGYAPPQKFTVPVRYLTPETMKTMFDFPADMAKVDAEVNRLNNQVLVRYFEEEWRRVMK
jgi:spermidine synthase